MMTVAHLRFYSFLLFDPDLYSRAFLLSFTKKRNHEQRLHISRLDGIGPFCR